MRAIALSAAVLALMSQAAPNVGGLGPQVGARVTDFSLLDQGGLPRSLAGVAGAKGTMLVFFRSADW